MSNSNFSNLFSNENFLYAETTLKVYGKRTEDGWKFQYGTCLLGSGEDELDDIIENNLGSFVDNVCNDIESVYDCNFDED